MTGSPSPQPDIMFTSQQDLDQVLGRVMLDDYVRRGLLMRWVRYVPARKWNRDANYRLDHLWLYLLPCGDKIAPRPPGHL